MNPPDQPAQDCYCVCHTPISSRFFCEHCQENKKPTRGEPSVEAASISVADQAAQKLDELLNKVYIAGYQAGKQSGLTMVIAGDVILPEARNEVLALMYQENLVVIGDDLGEGDDETFAYYFNMCKAEQRQAAAKRYGQIRSEE